MEEKHSRVFETADLYLTSALVVLLGVEPKLAIHNEKTFAQFKASDELYQAMAAYNRGDTASLFQYATTIKRIRGEFLNMKRFKT